MPDEGKEGAMLLAPSVSPTGLSKWRNWGVANAGTLDPKTIIGLQQCTHGQHYYSPGI